MVHQDAVNSLLVTNINLFARANPLSIEEDVIDKIISDIAFQKPEVMGVKTHITPKQIKQALAFPYSNFKSAVLTKFDYFSKLTELSKQEVICVKLLKRVEESQRRLVALKSTATDQDVNILQREENHLAQNKHNLQEQMCKLNAFREKMEEWRKAFEQKMEEHRETWIRLREELTQKTVEALEKSIKATLSTTEIQQLCEIEPLDVIYQRYDALGVKPPIDYQKAANDPKSFVLLKAYLVGREVKNRERIH